MHLKCLEISGFKSFPARTRLEFSSGMTAIVGPNGCGKSNISDAIRWVLGEQSAKMLRGAKMEDCIFNGTDNRKPLGMAEVSLTFADCEKTINTEFNEITITRRVFRSGEGQYFINKTPCRLKDIQRLFMDTGVGTNSYSLMEQGRLDLILSSRPEDRRAVFEEASGITKYKTDKREALRKLEHTEANLLRLADIIKEVKRQIISLQRQAGKARRVKVLRQELRSLDIFTARERITSMDSDIGKFEEQVTENKQTIDAFQEEILALEKSSESLRNTLADVERDISNATQKDGELRARLNQTEQSISAGQKRIEELKDLLLRDSSDADSAAVDLEKQRQTFAFASEALKKADEELTAATNDLNSKTKILAEYEKTYEKTRQSIENFYADSMDLENQLLKLQNRHHDMEAQDRNMSARRERTAAEQANLSRVLDGYEKRLAEFSDIIKDLEVSAADAVSALSENRKERGIITEAIKAAEAKKSEILIAISAAEAQSQIIRKSLDEKGAFPAGTMQLLDETNPLGINKDVIQGALFEQIDVSPEYRKALEAALRSVLDAVIVADIESGISLLRALESNADGSTRLLALETPAQTEEIRSINGNGTPLLDKISCPDQIRPLAQRLLSNVNVVASLDEIPLSIPEQAVYVTTDGSIVKGSGVMEFYRAETENGNPLAQKHQAMELEERVINLNAKLQKANGGIQELAEKSKNLDDDIIERQTKLTEAQNLLARKQGEHHGLVAQADRIRENLETVILELRELEKQTSSAEERSVIVTEIDDKRANTIEIKKSIAERKNELNQMEQERRRLSAEETEARVRFAQHKQASAHLVAQHAPLAERIGNLEALIRDRSNRSVGYKEEIEKQTAAISYSQKLIPAMQKEIEGNASYLSESGEQLLTARENWQITADKLKTHRSSLDKLRDRQSELNTGLVEHRMKRQAVFERVVSEHRIAPDAIAQEPEPQWPEGKPEQETLDNMIAELRAKIEAIGPVYEGAIEEYTQLEDRHTFLQNQQDDLIKSKQQLMDMIKKINQTTTEMFAQTFEVINNNFQNIFKQLFGGGSAKLMLADEEDILESGIEIIARPPGKRLQSVSLLSGGERALTAVSLLFAIYLFKPSPFCVLDELDAPLDETNIKRFINMLQGFLQQSQFLMITHNRQTIGSADVLYGVTMEEFGVSKIVSMKFTDLKKTPGEKELVRQEV